MSVEDQSRLLDIVGEIRLAGVASNLNELGIEALIFKGWTVRRFYPPDGIRLSSDIDIAVNPRDHEAAMASFFDGQFGSYLVDIHRGFRQLDPVPWDTLYGRSETIDVRGVPVRVPSEEDHLRIVCVHWLRDGGANKQRLWDVFYIVTNRKPDFDWDICLNSAGPIRKVWVTLAIAAAREHLGLNVEDLPESVRNAVIPEWFKRTLKKEWAQPIRDRTSFGNVVFRPRRWRDYLARRFPPNPISATVRTESRMDNSLRMPIQAKLLLSRIPYLWKSTIESARNRD